MAKHNTHVLVELAVKQELTRQFRDKVAIDSRAISESAIGRKPDLESICQLESRGRKLARFCYGRDVEQSEVILKCLFLLLVTDNRLPSRRLHDSLVERHSSLVTTVRGYLVLNASTSSRLAKHSDAVWVAAKFCDVRLDPFESKALIVQSSIGGTISLEGWAGQESKCSKAVVEADIDHALTAVVLAARQKTSGIARARF